MSPAAEFRWNAGTPNKPRASWWHKDADCLGSPLTLEHNKPLLRILKDGHACTQLLGSLHVKLAKKLPGRGDRPSPLRVPSPTAMPRILSPASFQSSCGVVAMPDNKAAPDAKYLLLLKQLGSGGYGRVSLVRDMQSRRVYALKRVCKAHMLAHNGMMRCEWLLREKRVLEELEHPFIVSVHATYSDDANLFLLLGAALGGELHLLNEKLGQVPEKIASFYAGSLVLALAHIHDRHIVYRDLKPENVLLDAQGFVKLCDFGFAKKVGAERTFTRCGTPDYVAPEMLLNQGVDRACDWWALGVLIFEMLCGVLPFTDPDGDDMKTYANITNREISSCYPDTSTVTDEARSLLRGLCTIEVAQRLGSLTHGRPPSVGVIKEGSLTNGRPDDVVAHGWFAGFDWHALTNLTLEPPWRPRLSSPEDTTCFDLEVDGGNSLDLDGPSHKPAPSEELDAKWRSLQAEYSDGAMAGQDLSHLI